jgi:pimeloyl-ACP methyl ester carboxylesterase
MVRQFVRVLVAALLGLGLTAGSLSAQTITSSSTHAVGPLLQTDSVVTVGPSAIDKFGMHRLRRAQGAVRGALLLLPPLGNGFSFFTADDSGNPLRSFAAYFALRGWEVWGYSPRATGLVAGSCESGAVDCSSMAHWGIQTTIDDAAFIRSRIAAALPAHRPVLVGGFSLGGMTTIATIDAHPDDYDGAFVLEGALYAENPAVLALNQGYCAGLEAQLAAGQIYDGQSLPFIRTAIGLGASNPTAPSPFFPGLSNHQGMIFLLAVPQIGPLWPTENFIRCAGDVGQDRFFYSEESRVITFSSFFNDYTDNLTIRDISCSLAGERTFTGNLGAFTGPVYLMGGGVGFAEQNQDLVHILGSNDVTFNEIAAFGHADHWFTQRHRQRLEGDLDRWLNRVR